MTHAGCLVWNCLLVAIAFIGAATARRHGVNPVLGFTWGMITFVALVTGYASALSVIDRVQRPRYPDRIGVPRWAIVATWVTFLMAGVASVVLFGQLRPKI